MKGVSAVSLQSGGCIGVDLEWVSPENTGDTRYSSQDSVQPAEHGMFGVWFGLSDKHLKLLKKIHRFICQSLHLSFRVFEGNLTPESGAQVHPLGGEGSQPPLFLCKVLKGSFTPTYPKVGATGPPPPKPPLEAGGE